MSDLEVPWAIHHSEHSARLARVQAQQLLGTGSGVSRPGDLKVQPLNVPGNGFRVAPGGGTAQSRDTDASARESYGPLLGSELVVTDVPGTGSGETRRDLVILEITDPAMQSVTYPAPEDPEYTGGWLDGDNFNRITVIPNVGSQVTSLDQITTGDYAHVTGITLAAINWPESTGTITAAMIEDLRELQNPRRQDVLFARPRVSEDNGAQASLSARMTSASGTRRGELFPGGAGFANEVWIDIPEWATRFIIEANWMSVRYNGGANPYGYFWVEYGTEWNAGGWTGRRDLEFYSQDFSFNAPNVTDNNNTNWILWDELPVPAKIRGKRCRFVFKAGYADAAPSGLSGSVLMNASAGLGLRATFAESALDAHLL